LGQILMAAIGGAVAIALIATWSLMLQDPYVYWAPCHPVWLTPTHEFWPRCGPQNWAAPILIPHWKLDVEVGLIAAALLFGGDFLRLFIRWSARLWTRCA